MGCAAAPFGGPAARIAASYLVSGYTQKPRPLNGRGFVQLNFELEVEAGGQQGCTACCLAGEVRSIGFVVVGLVGQVLYVQL